MKDKTKVKDKISFVLNGEPILPDAPKPIDEKMRIREEMERLQRRKKKQEEND